MAIGAPVLITNNASGTNVDSYTTASFTPNAGRVLVAMVTGRTLAGTPNSPPTITETHSGSWTWLEKTRGSSGIRLTMFTAEVPASPGAGTLTFTFPTGDQDAAAWSVVEVPGALAAWTNSAMDASVSASVSISLASAPAASSMVIAAIGARGDASAGVTPGAGYTEVSDQAVGTTIALQVQYDLGSPAQSITWSDAGTTVNCMVGIELFEAPTQLIQPTAQELGLAFPDPTLVQRVAVAAHVAFGIECPSPADMGESLRPTTAEVGATFPSPDVFSGGPVELSPPTMELLATFPAPELLVPFALVVTTQRFEILFPEPTLTYGYVVPTDTPEFLGAPIDNADARQFARQISSVVNRTLQGKLNVSGTVTLQANKTKTFLRDGRLGEKSVVSFDPMTATAAAEKAAGTIYVLEADRSNGTWILTHASAASTDRTFRVSILG